jgi:hypothetical protein
VARFFFRDFLGAELVIDSRQGTKLLLKALNEAENRLRDALPPDQLSGQLAALKQASRTVLSQPAVKVEEVGKGLAPAARKAVSEAVAAVKLPTTATVQVHSAYLKKAQQTVRYEGDFDLTVEVQAGRFDELFTVTKFKPAAGPTKHRVVIETEKWKKVK